MAYVVHPWHTWCIHGIRGASMHACMPCDRDWQEEGLGACVLYYELIRTKLHAQQLIHQQACKTMKAA